MKGWHALICPGSALTQLRQNSVRDLLKNAVEDAWFTAFIESWGDHEDLTRPGDLRIENRNGRKDLLIDVAVVHPPSESHRYKLIKWEAGAPATAYKEVKRSKCRGMINETRFDFLPFVLETSVGGGWSAFCSPKNLREKSNHDPAYTENVFVIAEKNQTWPLLIALSFFV